MLEILRTELQRRSPNRADDRKIIHNLRTTDELLDAFAADPASIGTVPTPIIEDIVDVLEARRGETHPDHHINFFAALITQHTKAGNDRDARAFLTAFDLPGETFAVVARHVQADQQKRSTARGSRPRRVGA